VESNFYLIVVLSSLASAILTAGVCAYLWKRSASRSEAALSELTETVRGLEKSLHLKERDFLEERNRLEVAHAEALRTERSKALEEGRQMGLTERDANHAGELIAQRTSLAAKFESERQQAVVEAREKARKDYELQAKLFTVKISPFVSVKENKGFINHNFETVTGYQYQLLVNGIPAFAPHVMAEQTETRKEFNPEVERALLDTAKKLADSAIDIYLAGSTQFAKIAAPVLKRLPAG
jgi:hypothetical protein